MAMRLFLSNETDFTSNGHKYIESIFTHEIRNNSEWYLDVRVPLEFIEFIEQDNIVVVKTKEKGKQPFRIKDITVGSDIRFEAWHIGFDTKVFTVSLSTVINLNCQNAITEILGDTQTNNFTSFSDISGLQTFSIINMTLYEALLDVASRYNGFLDFDGWQIRIVSSIGSDKGVTIAYGKNLESAEVEERWDMVCTELQPLGNNGLVGSTVFSSIVYDRPYAKIVSFDTDDLTTLNNLASAYVSRFESPQMYYKVKANVDGGLGDTIQVKARQFTVFTQVLGYKFNVKTQQMIEIEFGNFRPTVKNAIGQLREEIVQVAERKAQIKIDDVNGEIDLRVKKDEVIASINLSPETIKILAPNIALEGIITANGNVKIDALGNIEVLNGIFNGNITAQTGSIGRFAISSDDLVYTSDLFDKDYDESDLVKLHRLILEFEPTTAYDLAIYDFNNSGTLSIFDLFTLDNFLKKGVALPTPRKRIRSIVRIGTNQGALTTQAVAENGSLGSVTTIRGEKITGDLLNVNSIFSNVANFKEVFQNGKRLPSDYEEGTFTPVLSGLTTAGVGTYTVQEGKYTKVGNKVTFGIRLIWTAHTGTGGMIVSLPFTSTPGTFNPCSIVASNLIFSGSLGAMIGGNENRVVIYQFASNTALTVVGMDTNAALYINGTYMV